MPPPDNKRILVSKEFIEEKGNEIKTKMNKFEDMRKIYTGSLDKYYQ